MARLFIAVVVFLVYQECTPRAVPDEGTSVVSVYTTLPTTPHHQLDVYHQIASNIAERITSPIYRFLGFGKNTTEAMTTKAPWKNVEIFDDPEEMTKPELKPVDNHIGSGKDVEELSTEGLKKIDRKPEKITLFSNYLPSQKEPNDTINEVDDNIETFGFDDDGIEDDSDESPREGPLIYILEIIGSIIQLIYGGIVAFFSPSSSSSSSGN